MSHSEFNFTPIRVAGEPLPDLTKFDNCNVCVEGRLYSRKVRLVTSPFWAPLAVYFGLIWAICGTMAAAFTFCFAVYTVSTVTTNQERHLAGISLGMFFVFFSVLAIAGWALLKKHIVYRCELCGETISKRVYLARLKTKGDVPA